MLWLPATAVLSFGETLTERNIECGIVGMEGAIGWEPLIGLPRSGQRLAALIGGTIVAISCDRLAQIGERRPAIVAHLLRYRETLLIQMRWTIAARLQNGPDRRLARWLCMLHDRVEGDTLDITHLRLAAFLNARRASITDSLHVLEGERIVRCTRGKIFVRDRSALEAAAGPAYGPAEAAYAALFER
ncbi:Crp/Fnr family transcriptional regulator [Sphingomonas qomolangmaensis]|uniref:Helix-turn-helix domain-containing protein n=1 Tax=Sphingomonas qomolangmaensis TaxID=2918765 RepID=A0ABY5L2M2_9SPHN|nr:helix-turn-helix domain-containing protein [Sphingomonas qomolangmaensis]UUL81204.1 helix-turn-helix domain-containing protein [Sphingomonas qomolangmaensis]